MRMIDILKNYITSWADDKPMTLSEKRALRSQEPKRYTVQLDCSVRKKNKYYPEISMLVNSILSAADALLEYNEQKYIDSVAVIKANVPDDFADRVSYDVLSEASLRQCIERLSDYDDEVRKYLSLERTERERQKGIEIGSQSLRIVGTDSVSKLDDAIRVEREKKEQQTNERINKVADAMSALRGDKSALANIFNKVSETTSGHMEASEGHSDDPDQSSKGTSDDGVNPKGEE